MTEPLAPRGRYGESIAAEVAALEGDIRHRVVDLEEAFTSRDWATVARIYRARGRGLVGGHAALTRRPSNTCFGVPKRPPDG